MKNRSVYTDQEVSFKEKIAYGLGDGATAFAAVTVASFSMFYFTDYVGVNAATLGLILFVSRFFDSVTNLLMGHWVDKTDTKYGKARPWILWTIIPFAISLILSFSIPTGWSETLTLVYITVIVNLYFIAYTASNIPYGTLGSLISRDQQVRSDLNIYRMISYFVGSIIIGAITMPLVNFFGNDNKAWTYVMIIYGIALGLIFLFTFKNTKERVGAEAHSEDATEQEDLPLGQSLKLVVTNKYWVILFFIILAAWSLLFMLNNVNIYFAEHILNNSGYVGILNGLFTGGLLIGFLSLSILLRKISRRKLIAIGLVILITSSLAMVIDTTNWPLIATTSFLRGLGFAPIMGTAYAMLADVIDYGEWKNGVRNEGLTFAGGTFATTIGTGIASGGVGMYLGANGYISGASTVQPETVYDSIQFLFVVAPAILGAIVLVLLYFYDLDDIHSDIIEDLK